MLDTKRAYRNRQLAKATETHKKKLLTANVCANVCRKKIWKILEISEKIVLRVQIFN